MSIGPRFSPGESTQKRLAELKSSAQHVGPPKSDAGRRTLAIPSGIVPDLDAWVATSADALLFIGERGAALRAGMWQRKWDRSRRSIGQSQLRLHDLRHVAGTQDAALRYQHATDERDRELADGIDRIIRAKRVEPSAEILRLPERLPAPKAEPFGEGRTVTPRPPVP